MPRSIKAPKSVPMREIRPPAKWHPPKNCGGDRRKLHRCAETAVRVADESGVQDTGKRCQQAADDKNSKFYSANLLPPEKLETASPPTAKDAISDRSFENHQLKHRRGRRAPKLRWR